jgi:hypothetical protein
MASSLQDSGQQQESQIVRIPFLETPHARDVGTGKDLRFINGYFEPIRNVIKNRLDYFFTKRPGLSQNIRPSGGAGVGRGVYAWKGNIYSVIGTQIYKGITNLGVTLTTSTGRCKFAETRPGAATNYLCVNDGVRLYAIAVGGAVTTVTVNFPNPNTRDLIYMNTYLLTLDSKANLWNCNSDDPTTWSASQFITAQMMNGTGTGLAKIQNLIVVFTDRHMQMFADTANASGSPLTNAEQYMRRVGCDAPDTIQHEEDMLFWVGNGYTGGYTVWKHTGTSAIEDIGIAPLNRILSLEGTNLANARAVIFRHAGHIFYILTLVGANRTFVYDPDINYWTEWTDTTGNNAWPVVDATEYQDGVIVQHTTNGWIYNVRSDVFQDDSVSFTLTARTPRTDFDTIERKFVNRLDIVADRQTSPENVSISYTDDDYQTFSAARTYDISVIRNFGRAWGNFRRRSWQLQYTGSQAFRCVGLELTVSLED